MIYFDNSATSRFKPKCVIEEYNRFVLNSCNSGRSGHKDCIKTATKVMLTRENIKNRLGANDDYEVIFTQNCTESLNMAILGFVSPKSHVITTIYEHNSVLRPLKFLEDNFDVKVTYLLPDLTGKIMPSQIEEAITNKTTLVIVNQTSNVTGISQEISEIGKITQKHNIKLLVDTAQSLGHEQIDMQNFNIDMLASCGHKGIHGMQGIGFLVIKKDIKLKHIKFGGTGTDSDLLIQPDHYPEGYECGTLNTGGVLSLSKAFDWTYSNFNELNRHYKYLSGEII
ncbi:MAG: aminotransferase class V-fold PLP-dependent enzyme, partial [Clostridia bacterium]|nr:aminotransferase class V-fold PLP-dependent enzyme [Clostridia bacterium]